jgi:membrane fusion protein, multidrug efflux system
LFAGLALIFSAGPPFLASEPLQEGFPLFKLPSSYLSILALTCAAFTAAGCGSKTDATAEQAKPAQQAAAPKPSGLPVKAETVTVGKVVDESVMIRPEIDGRIVGLHFQEGQAVSAGQRLVTIDSSEYEAQLAAVEADLRTEQQRFDRTQELYQQKFISKEALDVQRGAVERLKARVDEARSRVAKTVIRAPFAGVAGLREVSPGAYVKAGADIVPLESVGLIKADFRVPEIFLSKIGRNQEVALRLDAYPGEEFRGRVYAIQPMVEETTRTVLMRARVPNKGFKLKPGMFARVMLTLDSRAGAITVPEQALWPQGQDNFVFRVIDGKAQLTKVILGKRAPGMVEVTQGLAEGDVVVTEGQIKLRDGAPVMVMGAPQPAAGGSPQASEAQKAG